MFCSVNRPNANSYVVPDTLLAAGEYPARAPTTLAGNAREKLPYFLDAGISAFVDLTDPADGLEPYYPVLYELAAARGIDVAYEQFTIADMDVCNPSHMSRVLDAIDAHLVEGRGTYVHCWGGMGRTGMVVACWLVRHGRSSSEALDEVKTLFQTMSAEKVRRFGETGSPQTESQRALVRSWASLDGANASGRALTDSGEHRIMRS